MTMAKFYFDVPVKEVKGTQCFGIEANRLAQGVLPYAAGKE